jgi:hypothetical protein
MTWCLEHVVLELKLIFGLYDPLLRFAAPPYLVNCIENGNEWSLVLDNVSTLSWHKHPVA